FTRAARDIHTAASCRLMTSQRATQESWFASDHTRHAVTARHAVCIHDPCHHLRVGINVRCRNVAVRPDKVRDLVGIATGETFQLSLGEMLRIADDPSLRTAEGNIYGRALPRHPRSQRLDFIEGDVRVIADPTFTRSTRVVVLYAKSLEGFQGAIVHLDRQ